MRSNTSKSEKWYKPYDPIIWIGLLVLFIGIILYQDNNSGYSSKEITFNKNITTIKEAIDETDKIVKEKYGDKYQICSISGFASNIHKGIDIQPNLEISYLKVKGLSRRKIDYSVSLEDDKIQSTYIGADTTLDRKIDFYYNPEKLDIANMIDIIESKVDMEKVRSGYEPYLNFIVSHNEMNINVGYYKNIKNSGADFDSRVNYGFTIDTKTQKIIAESVEDAS